MEDELKTINETAKAVQEASKAGKAVVDAASDLGKFVAKVLGTIPEDIVGLAFGDYLREIRTRNMDKIRRRTDQILKQRGVKKTKPIGPKHAIPAFKAMADESDETLQELWARLLANAMDPRRSVNLENIFIEALHQFEPMDALVLEKLSSVGSQQRSANRLHSDVNIGERQSMVQLSLDRLESIGCIARAGSGSYVVKALGEELLLVVKD